MCNSEETKIEVMKKYSSDWSWIKGYFDKRAANEVLVVLFTVVKKLVGEDYARLEWKATLDKVKKEIDEGYPVVILTKCAGGGHFITVVGYDDVEKAMIVHDPWGDYNHRYRGQSGLNGEYKKYSYDLWDKGLVKQHGTYYIHADKRVKI